MPPTKAVRKPSLGSVLLINGFMAILAQLAFLSGVAWLFLRLRDMTATDSGEALGQAIYLLAISAGGTGVVFMVVARLAEKIVPLDIRDLRDREILRAMHYAALGVIGICMTRTILLPSPVPTLVLGILIVAMLILGNYHLKFREARQGIWFPHAVFHFGFQWLMFPVGMSLLIQFLR